MKEVVNGGDCTVWYCNSLKAIWIHAMTTDQSQDLGSHFSGTKLRHKGSKAARQYLEKDDAPDYILIRLIFSRHMIGY